MTGRERNDEIPDRYRYISPLEARAAARLKLTIDEARGLDTPQWIKDLAQADLPAPRPHDSSALRRWRLPWRRKRAQARGCAC